MGIALSALGGFFVATYLLFAKLGLTGPIVCGVGDCGRVQASRWAEILGVPVAAWGVIGYGLLFATAMAGLRPAGIADRRIAAALVAFAAVAFGFSAYLTALEAFVIRAWCQWCVVSAGLAALIFLLALMELPRLTRSD
ncbi:MAG: vitamin K epoxide reductase family protein [Gemmatimonadota bacterium]